MKEEKKPVALVGCVRVPPGVLVSSAVGVKGSGMEFDNLLGRFVLCARRCLMLSREFNGRPAGGEFRGTEVSGCLGENVNASAEGLVGVGGVTRVVGVSIRLGGVAGNDVVLMRPL